MKGATKNKEPKMCKRDQFLSEDYKVDCVDFSKTTIGDFLDALDKVSFKYAKKIAEENMIDFKHPHNFISAQVTYFAGDYLTIVFTFIEFTALEIVNELIEEMLARFGAWGHLSRHDKPGAIEFNISIE